MTFSKTCELYQQSCTVNGKTDFLTASVLRAWQKAVLPGKKEPGAHSFNAFPNVPESHREGVCKGSYHKDNSSCPSNEGSSGQLPTTLGLPS